MSYYMYHENPPEVDPERDAQIQALLNRCAKQAKIGKQYRLPSFSCPSCGAKNILFAGDTVTKNETVIKVLEENDTVDYIIICPKCKKHIGIRRHVGIELSDAKYRCLSGIPVSFYEIFNHRLLTEKERNSLPDNTLILEGVIDDHPDNLMCYGKIYHFLLPKKRYDKI